MNSTNRERAYAKLQRIFKHFTRQMTAENESEFDGILWELSRCIAEAEVHTPYSVLETFDGDSL
jgi:hypothetical protein